MGGSTVFLGVYGSFRLYPWLESESVTQVISSDSDETFTETYRGFGVRPELTVGDADEISEEDVYSVFMARSTSMMWAGDNPPQTRLWEINDANVEWSPGSSGQVAWFQVDVLNKAERRRRLSVQPIVACARDALSRFGELTLTGTQMLLPMELASDQYYLTSGLNWFELSDSAARLPIRITLDGGSDDEVQRKASEVFAMLKKINSGQFTFHSYSADAAVIVRLEPNVVGDMWLGGGRN
ncbi:MAG: hypothetical protein ACRD3Q_11960, partial [Terriglobales bacterium]